MYTNIKLQREGRSKTKQSETYICKRKNKKRQHEITSNHGFLTVAKERGRLTNMEDMKEKAKCIRARL